MNDNGWRALNNPKIHYQDTLFGPLRTNMVKYTGAFRKLIKFPEDIMQCFLKLKSSTNDCKFT